MNNEDVEKLRRIIEELKELENACDYIHDELRINEAILLLERVID